MEILNNFSSIYFFVAFIIGAVFMLAVLSIAAMGKVKEPKNKVHFYVARDKDGRLWLYIGKPIRSDVEFRTDLNKRAFVLTHYLKRFDLKYEDYAYLKWEDEPVEVFINMED